MLVRVFFSTRYSVDDPRSDARSSPSSATLRPRYSVSSAATEPSRRPLMASTSATLLAFGTASPPQTKTDGPRPSAWRTPRVEAPLEVLACAGALDGPSCHAATGRSLANEVACDPDHQAEKGPSRPWVVRGLVVEAL